MGVLWPRKVVKFEKGKQIIIIIIHRSFWAGCPAWRRGRWCGGEGRGGRRWCLGAPTPPCDRRIRWAKGSVGREGPGPARARGMGVREGGGGGRTHLNPRE